MRAGASLGLGRDEGPTTGNLNMLRRCAAGPEDHRGPTPGGVRRPTGRGEAARGCEQTARPVLKSRSHGLSLGATSVFNPVRQCLHNAVVPGEPSRCGLGANEPTRAAEQNTALTRLP